jgi:hypothetical protein
MKWLMVVALIAASAAPAKASGHGPVFGATTPTLGRGGWSVDQAWTMRTGDDDDRQQMLKTMFSFGVTENLQLSASFPLAMSDGTLPKARMMSLMSNERELEGLAGYRFQRRTIGIGGRQESTMYVGANAASLVAGIATGYASRAQYVWVGGNIQHNSRLVTAVYGYRPAPLRTEPGKPDLRFFVEATAEHRDVARTVFVGPTALLLHKAIGIEGGVLFPAYQRVGTGFPKERLRIAVNVAYFFWLK